MTTRISRTAACALARDMLLNADAERRACCDDDARHGVDYGTVQEIHEIDRHDVPTLKELRWLYAFARDMVDTQENDNDTKTTTE